MQDEEEKRKDNIKYIIYLSDDEIMDPKVVEMEDE